MMENPTLLKGDEYYTPEFRNKLKFSPAMLTDQEKRNVKSYSSLEDAKTFANNFLTRNKKKFKHANEFIGQLTYRIENDNPRNNSYETLYISFGKNYSEKYFYRNFKDLPSFNGTDPRRIKPTVYNNETWRYVNNIENQFLNLTDEEKACIEKQYGGDDVVADNLRKQIENNHQF